MKSTTLKELAYLLNLSISTVSKALNNSPEISKVTKVKVKEMAEACGYEPNFAARSLRLGESWLQSPSNQYIRSKSIRSLGVIVPNIIEESYAKAIQSIVAEANSLNYNIVIGISDVETEKEKESLEMMISRGVLGILISLSKETQLLEDKENFDLIIHQNHPIVLFKQVFEKFACDKVTNDDFDGAFQATEYLIDSGCNNIAFLSAIEDTSLGELRKQGYLQALKMKTSKKIQPILIKIDNYENFEIILKQALKTNKIDGVLAADEQSAICALNMIQLAGFKVPEDISIIGFNNSLMTKHSNPPMTTVSEYSANLGKEALTALIERVENKNSGIHVHKVIKTNLTIRNSTHNLN